MEGLKQIKLVKFAIILQLDNTVNNSYRNHNNFVI